MSNAIDSNTGEIIGGVRPLIDTMRQFPIVLDQGAIGLQEALMAVRTHGKAATITLSIKVEPMKSAKNQRLIDEPVMISMDAEVKLPKSGPEQMIFYTDDEGNATRNPPQKELSLGITIGGAERATGTGG